MEAPPATTSRPCSGTLDFLCMADTAEIVSGKKTEPSHWLRGAGKGTHSAPALDRRPGLRHHPALLGRRRKPATR